MNFNLVHQLICYIYLKWTLKTIKVENSWVINRFNFRQQVGYVEVEWLNREFSIGSNQVIN